MHRTPGERGHACAMCGSPDHYQIACPHRAGAAEADATMHPVDEKAMSKDTFIAKHLLERMDGEARRFAQPMAEVQTQKSQKSQLTQHARP